VTDVMLANQLNTLPEPAWTPMYANSEKSEEKMSAATGSPLRRVFLNIAGAFPAIASPSVCCVFVFCFVFSSEAKWQSIKGGDDAARALT
jgi:hypothetical protein